MLYLGQIKCFYSGNEEFGFRATSQLLWVAGTQDTSVQARRESSVWLCTCKEAEGPSQQREKCRGDKQRGREERRAFWTGPNAVPDGFRVPVLALLGSTVLPM